MKKTEQQEKQENRTGRSRRIRPGMAIFYAVLVLLILAGILWLALRRQGGYTRANIEHTYSFYTSSHARVEAFGDGFVHYSADGAGYVSEKGQEIWNSTFTMNTPFFATQGDYCLLADLSGDTVVILNQEGESGRFKTTDPILTAAVSASGVSVVALERDLNSLIRFYDKRGQQLDIEISLEMAVSGYPMAMAVSPDGSGLVLSMVSSQSGHLNSQLVFYNFTVGKGETNRLIGYFNHEGHLVTQVNYMNSKRVAAVTEDRLEIYSLDQENKPELLDAVLFPGEITAYALGSRQAAFLCPETGSGDLTLYVFDSNGKSVFSKPVEGHARRLIMGNQLVLLQTEEKLDLWELNGNSYFSGQLPRSSTSLFLLGKRLIQFDGSQIHHYQFGK